MPDKEPQVSADVTARLLEELARTNERLERLEAALREKKMLKSGQPGPGPQVPRSGAPEASGKPTARPMPNTTSGWKDAAAAAAAKPPASGSARDAESHFRRGVELCQVGKFDEALGAWQQVLRLQPDNVFALANIGIVLTETERWAEARESFARVLKLQPNNADAHYGLGMAEAQLGNYAGALTAFENSLRIKPDNPDARYNLGLVRQRLAQQGIGLPQRPPSAWR